MRKSEGQGKSPGLPFTALNRSVLEDDLSAHLKQARLVIGGNCSKARAAHRRSDTKEVRVVKHVKGLDAQLNVDALADLGVFRQSNVPLLEVRS
jgi:hypothetical protein